MQPGMEGTSVDALELLVERGLVVEGLAFPVERMAGRRFEAAFAYGHDVVPEWVCRRLAAAIASIKSILAIPGIVRGYRPEAG